MTDKVKTEAMRRPDFWIGIDPGVTTGYATYSTIAKMLNLVKSAQACQAEAWIMEWAEASRNDDPFPFHVVVEDTRRLRLPVRLQKGGNQYLKGVGSVHRDMSRWEEFLTFRDIPFTMAGLSPKPFREGNAEWFRKITGYAYKTNEHGRAAAGLVWVR